MNVNLSPVNTIIMSRIINQTPGGKINLYNTQGFNLQNDSLLVDSLILSITADRHMEFFLTIKLMDT